METPGSNVMNQIDLKQVGNPFLPVEPFKAGYAENISQRRSWMIHSHFKCPVVGACLSLKEQKRILKKTENSIKNRSAYEIHGIFVRSLSDKNRLSMRIDAYLHRKFKHEISKFSGLDRSLFLDVWKTHFQKGEMAGLLWVAATRTDLKEKDIDSIFGDIHMQMHLNAGHNIKLRQRLSSQREVNLKLNKKFKESIQTRRILKKENEGLEKEHAELRRQYAFLEKDKLAIEKELSNLTKNTRMLEFEDENQQLHDELANLTGEIWNYQQRQETLQTKNNKLLSKLESQSEINDHLKEETERIIAQISALKRCDETCPSFDLCQKRILIVGGIVKIKDHYKKLIEENGGIFEYHDGYVKGGAKGLKNQVRRADLVLCPVNCNSHNACSLVKKIGKKYSRPVQMLAGSGLGTISQALLESQKGVSIQ